MKNIILSIFVSYVTMPYIVQSQTDGCLAKRPINPINETIAHSIQIQKQQLVKLKECQQGMTEIDQKLIAEVLQKAQNLKLSSVPDDEFQKGVEKIVSDVYDLLSPAAKASLVQALFKDSLNSPLSLEFRSAFKNYMDAAEEHTKIFGPGGKYSSVGVVDGLRDKPFQKFNTSWNKVSDNFIALFNIIEKLKLPKDQMIELVEKIGNYNMELADQNNEMFKATKKRLESSQSTLYQLGTAAALTTVTLGAGSTTFSGLGTTLIMSIETGSSFAASTIVIEQAKLLAASAWAKGDFGCEYAIRAYEKNPAIAKNALISGILGFVSGAGSVAFASSTLVKYLPPIKTIDKLFLWANYTGKGLIGTYVVLKGRETQKLYKEAASFEDMANAALAQGNISEAAALEDQAIVKYEESHKVAIEAGSNVAQLIAFHINALNSTKKIINNIKQNEYLSISEKLKKESIQRNYLQEIKKSILENEQNIVAKNLALKAVRERFKNDPESLRSYEEIIFPSIKKAEKIIINYKTILLKVNSTPKEDVLNLIMEELKIAEK